MEEEEDYVKPEPTLESYQAMMREYRRHVEALEDKANRIASAVAGRSAWVEEWDNDSVTYEYNDACHCHPEYSQGSFPVEWLFEFAWLEKHKARQEEAAKKKQAVAEANAKLKQQQDEARERAQLEKLKKKYEG